MKLDRHLIIILQVEVGISKVNIGTGKIGLAVCSFVLFTLALIRDKGRTSHLLRSFLTKPISSP